MRSDSASTQIDRDLISLRPPSLLIRLDQTDQCSPTPDLTQLVVVDGRLQVPSPSTQPKRVKAKIYPDQPMDNPSEIIVYLALLKRNCLK